MQSAPDRARPAAGSAPTLPPVQPRAPRASAGAPAPAGGPAGSRPLAAHPGPERRPDHIWGSGSAPEPYRSGVDGAAGMPGAWSEWQLPRAAPAAVPLAKRLRQGKRVHVCILCSAPVPACRGCSESR